MIGVIDRAGLNTEPPDLHAKGAHWPGAVIGAVGGYLHLGQLARIRNALRAPCRSRSAAFWQQDLAECGELVVDGSGDGSDGFATRWAW